MFCRTQNPGEVAEWLKAPLSKSGSPERRRGFESHPLRHVVTHGAMHHVGCMAARNPMRFGVADKQRLLQDWTMIDKRRDAREAEGARLEIVYSANNGIEGSNPSLSATNHVGFVAAVHHTWCAAPSTHIPRVHGSPELKVVQNAINHCQSC